MVSFQAVKEISSSGHHCSATRKHLEIKKATVKMRRTKHFWASLCTFKESTAIAALFVCWKVFGRQFCIWDASLLQGNSPCSQNCYIGHLTILSYLHKTEENEYWKKKSKKIVLNKQSFWIWEQNRCCFHLNDILAKTINTLGRERGL